MRVRLPILAFAFLLALPVGFGHAEDQAQPQAAANGAPLEVRMGLIRRAVPPPPLYDLLAVPEDEAVAGAMLAIADNNTAGMFTGQHFTLEDVTLEEDEDPVAAARKMAAEGTKLITVNLTGAETLAVADAVKRLDRFETMLDNGVLRLADANPGDYQVVFLTTGRTQRRRLEDMGIGQGALLRARRKQPRGPIEVEAHGARLALGRGVASKILVTPHLIYPPTTRADS